MSILKSFFYDFKHVFTIDEKLIVLLAASIFLPFAVTTVMVVAIGFYVLVKSDFRSNIKSAHKSKVLLIFAVYLLVISMISGNWLGALLSVGIFFLFVVVIYYRKYIHKNLFEIMIDVMIVMSLICVVYAIGEQFHYASTVKGMDGFFDIQNKPQYRVQVFFFNANYYAMMILFVEAFCIYKFMTISTMKKRCYYVGAGLMNLFALYLTGGRIAWLCLAVAILVMLVVNKWYKTFALAMVGVAGAVGMLALKPNLIPRLAEKGLDLGRRSKIYETAILMIKDNGIFGQGPLTYYYRNADYLPKYIEIYGKKGLGKLGIKSQHAHTMFLEPLVSFGVVGTIIFLIYFGSQLKRTIRLITRKIDTALAALILGFVVITLTFSIIDFPIFWIQTGLLFLLVLGSSDIYKKEIDA